MEPDSFYANMFRNCPAVRFSSDTMSDKMSDEMSDKVSDVKFDNFDWDINMKNAFEND